MRGGFCEELCVIFSSLVMDVRSRAMLTSILLFGACLQEGGSVTARLPLTIDNHISPSGECMGWVVSFLESPCFTLPAGLNSSHPR